MEIKQYTYTLSTFDSQGENIEIRITTSSDKIGNKLVTFIRDEAKKQNFLTGGSSVFREAISLVPNKGDK